MRVMLKIFGCAAFAFFGIFAAAAILFGYTYWRVAEDHEIVSATVVSAEDGLMCAYVNRGSSTSRPRPSDRVGLPRPCPEDARPDRRDSTGPGGMLVLRTIRYRYISPVDGRSYTGSFHGHGQRTRQAEPGDRIEVLAHRIEPARSLGIDH
jgi:hypothetical protein